MREVDSALPKVRAARDHLLTQFFGQQGTTYERAKPHGDVFKQTLNEYPNNHTKTSGFWNEQGSLEPNATLDRSCFEKLLRAEKGKMQL